MKLADRNGVDIVFNINEILASVQSKSSAPRNLL